jgi:hypothetical protein
MLGLVSRDRKSRSKFHMRLIYSTSRMKGICPLPRFVEIEYKLEIGNAQNTQLSRAIASGAEKGTFVLPKGDAPLLFSRHLVLHLIVL